MGQLECGIDIGAVCRGGDRHHDLEIALEFGLGSAGPHDHPGLIGEHVAQAFGRRQTRSAGRQIVYAQHGVPAQCGRRCGPQAVHRFGDLADLNHPHRELVGGVHAVLQREFVQGILQAAPLGLESGGQLTDQQQGRDPVFVAHMLRVDAVAQCLLVSEGQPRDATDPLEAGQRLFVGQRGGRSDPSE